MRNEKKKRPPVQSKSRPKAPVQDVVYTPPAPLNRKKLILRLLTVAAVVMALFLGFSIFFRVENVVVSGTEKYTAWAVRQASGIQEGESLLSFGKARAAGRITEELRYIKSVRIGITLPDTVNTYVEELDVVYSAQDQQGRWWLLASDGRVVEQTTQEKAQDNTILMGFHLLKPVAGEQAEAAEERETSEEVEEPIITVTDRERLETALSIVTQLELNEILGGAVSVDVTNMEDIRLWYGSDYQVLLGDPGRMDEKIAMMKAVITQHQQEGGYQSGVLDITLTTDPDGVGYTPF